VAVPDWLGRAARIEADAMLPVRPSHALADLTGRLNGKEPVHARRGALRRGRLIHLLLQYLPEIAAPERRAAALRFLSTREAGLDAMARQNLAEEAVKVIELPELAGLFGPASRAEVAVAGKLVLGQRIIDVAGQIDRIGECPSEILLADFKIGTPCALDDTPAAHLAQMALYRAVLAPLWPNKTLRMLLIWTQGPLTVSLPAGKLEAALAAYAAG
jgi:ATP-dependent helicase/nuclease subunit A